MDNYNNTQSDINKEEAYLRAKKKVDKLKGFYWHLAAYLVVNTFLILMFNRRLDVNVYFWNLGIFATPIFWGIGLAFHFMGVFGPDLLFGKNWEKKKIDKFMNKDKQNWE